VFSGMPPVTDLTTLLQHLEPTRNQGTYVFATVPPGEELPVRDVVAMVREREGVSVVVEEARAQRLGLQPVMRCVWITLAVPSDLEAVGLTAAFAKALTDVGISCNVVAGTHHDHLFVPVDHSAAAMHALRELQGRDRSASPNAGHSA
jgi:hypothetical protein